MSDIAQGARAKLIINPGEIYRIGTAGVATVVRAYGEAAASTTITANTQTFGPYTTQTKLVVTANIRRCSITPMGGSVGQTVAAAVSGTLGVGNVLTAVPPSGVTVTSYQWTRDGASIAGATASTYAQVAADEAKTIAVNVAGVTSASAGVVPGPAPSAPAVTTAPVLAGSTVGQPITLTPGTVTGSPSPTSTFSWRDQNGAELSTSTATFTPTAAGQVTVVQRAVNASGEVSRMSNTITVSAAAAAAGAAVTRYGEGIAETVYAPAPARVLGGGAVLFDLASVAPVVSGSATPAASIVTDTRWNTPQSMKLLATVAGGMYGTWTTGTNPNFDTAKSYALEVFSSMESVSGFNGFNVTLYDNTYRSQAWTCSGQGLVRGWQLLMLCSPSDTVQRVQGSHNAIMQVGTTASGGMGGRGVASIGIGGSGFPAGASLVFGRIVEVTRVKPAVCFTYDQASGDISGEGVANPFATQIIPTFEKYGLVGSCRYHAAVDAGAPGNCTLALSKGWDLNNGTAARTTPNATYAGVTTDYGNNQGSMANKGFQPPIATLAAPPGNNTGAWSSDGQRAFKDLGIEYSKGSTNT